MNTSKTLTFSALSSKAKQVVYVLLLSLFSLLNSIQDTRRCWAGEVQILQTGESAQDEKKGESKADNTPLFPDKGLEAAVRYQVFEKRYNEQPLTEDDVKNISKVEGKSKGIQSLKGLEHCVSIQLIDLEGNDIADLGPIAELKQLQSINLAGNKIESIAALEKLTRVQYLELSKNKISDIRPLKDMTNMMSLYLSENQIQDIEVVAGLPKVWSLYLAGNPISNLTPISQCKRVDTLDLANCQVDDLQFLKPLTELKRVILSNNKISDLAPLVEMAKADTQRRFAPFWNLHLDGNPLGDNAKAQLDELRQTGARTHLK